MRSDDFTISTVDDVARLELEGQFLRLEASALRAKAAEVDQIVAEKDARIAQLTQDLAAALEAVPSGFKAVEADELKALRKARSDLQWVMTRISNSPLRLLLRRRAGYRRLEATYLSDRRG